MKFERLGWVVAAALAGAMVSAGFQSNTLKIGSVDMNKVLQDSDYAGQQNDVLKNLQASRRGVLDYIDAHRTMKVDDAKKFRDLSTKANPSAADKDALDKLKASIAADDAVFRDLQTKTSPTDADKAKLAEYSQRVQQLGALEETWAQEFSQEVQKKYDDLRTAAVGKVKVAVSQVARNQGYSIVFDSNVAPYTANDLTEEATKAMNKK